MDNEKDKHPIVDTFMSVFQTMLESKEKYDSIEWSRVAQEQLNELRSQNVIEGVGYNSVNLQARVMQTYIQGLKSQLKGVTTIFTLLDMHTRAWKIMENTLTTLLMLSQSNVDDATKKQQQMILTRLITEWLDDAKSKFDEHKTD